jgi:TonB family protein
MKKVLTFITLFVGLVYFPPLHAQTEKELNHKLELLEKAINDALADIVVLKENVIDLQKELSRIKTENDSLKQIIDNLPEFLLHQPRGAMGGGTGSKGTGISCSLAGRTATSTPKPNYPGREDGTVVVKITVDKSGRVTAAEPGQRGTTTMNPDLHDAARRAALQAKFNVDENAPALQTGTITYRFIIQSQ